MSGIDAFTRKTTPTFGPRGFTRHDLMGIRFVTDNDDEGAGGNDNDDKKSSGDKYTPPASQADLDRIINERLARERGKFADYDQVKKDAEELKTLKAASASDQEKAIQKAVDEATAKKDAEIIDLKARTALERALDGRVLKSASALFDLDRKQFVKDGAVDSEAVTAWVSANSDEATKPAPTKDRSQGNRDETAGSGSVQAGRELFESRKKSSK